MLGFITNKWHLLIKTTITRSFWLDFCLRFKINKILFRLNSRLLKNSWHFTPNTLEHTTSLLLLKIIFLLVFSYGQIAILYWWNLNLATCLIKYIFIQCWRWNSFRSDWWFFNKFNSLLVNVDDTIIKTFCLNLINYWSCYSLRLRF